MAECVERVVLPASSNPDIRVLKNTDPTTVMGTEKHFVSALVDVRVAAGVMYQEEGLDDDNEVRLCQPPPACGVKQMA